MCSSCDNYYEKEEDYYYGDDYGDPYDPSPPLAVIDEEDLDVEEALNLLREAA